MSPKFFPSNFSPQIFATDSLYISSPIYSSNSFIYWNTDFRFFPRFQRLDFDGFQKLILKLRRFLSCIKNLCRERATLLNKMDEHNNHQNSINHLHSQTRDRNMEQLRWPDLQTYVNQSPSMSTIPTGTDGSAAFPPNWIPGSSVQFLHPSGVLPYNLMKSDDKADERLKRQEALKRNRDYILDQRFEAQKLLQTRLVQTEHSITMENQKTPLLKDIKYINAELLEAYKELKALNKSSFVIPEDQYDYDMKMEWIQMLKAQLAAKKRKLNLATSPVQSSEPQASASDVSTSKITPRRLDDEDWSSSHDVHGRLYIQLWGCN